ncbi:MAG: hypothetical protein WA709_35140, partial [Stellaceae bacterium]
QSHTTPRVGSAGEADFLREPSGCSYIASENLDSRNSGAELGKKMDSGKFSPFPPSRYKYTVEECLTSVALKDRASICRKTHRIKNAAG